MARGRAIGKGGSVDWVTGIRDSSHDVVLAGLASLARAYGPDRKRAHADFRTLVAEGRKLEPEVHEAARKAWGEWIEKPSHAMGLRPDGRLQGVFDERVRSVLHRLGVPTAEDIADLRAMVERLLARERLVTASVGKHKARAKAHRRGAAGRPAGQRPKSRAPSARRGRPKAE